MTAPLRIPFSDFASEEARQALVHDVRPAPRDAIGDVAALRAYYDRQNAGLVARMRDRYPTETREIVLGGVRVQEVTPVGGTGDEGRALLCLHGGAFLWGDGDGALVEAIPIAAESGMRVLAVDYAMAPEASFPAASRDVAAVYAALADLQPAHSVGVYGCSAGAVLAAQAIAWLRGAAMPLPGGVAMLCGAGIEGLGDSAYYAAPLTGVEAERDPVNGLPLRLVNLPYFQGTAPGDPRAFPSEAPEVLRDFPPSLLVTGSRDFASSGVSTFHRRLVAAGVDARLFLFDGMWHAFQMFPELPEAQEAYRLVAGFFRRTLTP